MKIFSLAILLVILVSGTNANPLRVDDPPYIVREFKKTNPENLRVKINGGGISVSSRASDKVRVELFVRKGSRLIAPGESIDLGDFNISFNETPTTVSVEVEQKSSGWFSWFTGNDISISCVVYVPQRISCVLLTSGGSIDLKGVSGTQEVKTSGGGIHLERIKGNMEAKTSGGGIDVTEYAGRLQAHTSGGSITIQKARGEFDVSTSGGGIRLSEIDGSIEASTSGGGIHATIGDLNKYLVLKTSGGSITAEIPSGLGLDLDLKGNNVNTHLTNFSGHADEDRVVGSINGGGAKVMMATSGGSVNLQYR